MPGKGGNDRKFSPHLLRGVRGAEIHTGEKKSGCDGVGRGRYGRFSGHNAFVHSCAGTRLYEDGGGHGRLLE